MRVHRRAGAPDSSGAGLRHWAADAGQSASQHAHDENRILAIKRSVLSTVDATFILLAPSFWS